MIVVEPYITSLMVDIDDYSGTLNQETMRIKNISDSRNLGWAPLLSPSSTWCLIYLVMRSFLRFNLDTSFLSIVVFGEFIVDDKRGDEVKKFWLRNIFVLLCSRFTKLQEEIVRPRSGDAAPFVVKPTLKMSEVWKLSTIKRQWLLLFYA
ncbi:hypothetical protein YC2023_011945 [Brassica napus]